MDTNDWRFVRTLETDRQMLDRHGFDAWPDVDTLTRRVCEIEDGLFALADACGIDLDKDSRNRWITIQKRRR